MQGPGLPSPGQPSVIRPLIAFLRWCRNIHLLPISYAFLPRLRGRLTLRRWTLRRKPWAYSEEALHLLYRYSCQHSHFRYLQRTSHAPSPAYGTLSYHASTLASAASVTGLSPVTSFAQDDSISELLRFL